MAELTTKEASSKYDLSAWRIAQLAKLGKIKGRLLGHTWVIDEDSLAEYVRTPHKPGPPKGQPRKKRLGDEQQTEGEAAA